MRRRVLLGSALAAPALLALSSPPSRAQGFDHTLRIIVPNAPGGTSDILARLIAPELTQALGQSVVVENRAGAGGNIGADAVAKSPPDGHTMLLLDVSVLATNPALFPRLPYNAETDLAPVSMVIYAPYILTASNKLEAKDAQQLVALAKGHRGGLNAGNSGNGTASHLTQVALADQWGTEMTHVPYRGGAPALMAVTSGEADLTVAGATQSQPYAVNGQMRAIAVTGARRLASLPDVPTFRELGWTAEDAGTWQGLLVQGKTPPAQVALLYKALQEVLARPALAARIAELGGEPRADGPEAFRAWLSRETERYGQLIRAHNIRAE
ncbi:tripartite tricarboxylate transporter substrate binding protein [Roseomonas sp. M0104]|uniref:Tripartite tricarboxylate transporter substrate binding protein n=1 Tax=Teichococcus coralli TaxID=2545983 RepID=A0A845BHI6_9PROT|nr:tripartite tricarboxylate transporter substrate-binding protein [Pseudoroseomonas coralli]MXP65524.1 tripartite tricarboxylate transporter substrate binding protein [Pseudoroseomonas coralli]